MILLGKNTPFSKNPVLHPNKNVLYFKRREEFRNPGAPPSETKSSETDPETASFDELLAMAEKAEQEGTQYDIPQNGENLETLNKQLTHDILSISAMEAEHRDMTAANTLRKEYGLPSSDAKVTIDSGYQAEVLLFQELQKLGLNEKDTQAAMKQINKLENSGQARKDIISVIKEYTKAGLTIPDNATILQQIKAGKDAAVRRARRAPLSRATQPKPKGGVLKRFFSFFKRK
jgi:hypothetical protein